MGGEEACGGEERPEGGEGLNGIDSSRSDGEDTPAVHALVAMRSAIGT